VTRTQVFGEVEVVWIQLAEGAKGQVDEMEDGEHRLAWKLLAVGEVGHFH